jgi:RNA polymerase sigma-70 factor (ECF subfamily)
LSSERQEEFVRLLTAAHGTLLRYLVSLIGRRHDAEDVLQLASVAMWRRFESFEHGSDFMAWAATFAFYEAQNFRRKRSRSPLIFTEELMHTLAAERIVDLETSPSRDAILEGCLQKLDSPARDLIEAVYLQSVDIKEFAARQGRAVQTIYNRLNFIRRVLTECVQQRLGEALK